MFRFYCILGLKSSCLVASPQKMFRFYRKQVPFLLHSCIRMFTFRCTNVPFLLHKCSYIVAFFICKIFRTNKLHIQYNNIKNIIRLKEKERFDKFSSSFIGCIPCLAINSMQKIRNFSCFSVNKNERRLVSQSECPLVGEPGACLIQRLKTYLKSSAFVA